MRRLFSSLLLSLGIASAASAVTMDWTPVGNPGNACDPQPHSVGTPFGGCFGAVGYNYSIGTYEVTNAQYTEFLNAKAKTDPFGLYFFLMGDPSAHLNGHGGITRSGTSGNYTYTAIPGRETMPVNYVTFFDALRFANWINNGQGAGDTESGAYTLPAVARRAMPERRSFSRAKTSGTRPPTTTRSRRATSTIRRERIHRRSVAVRPQLRTGRTVAMRSAISSRLGAIRAPPALMAPSIRAATSVSGPKRSGCSPRRSATPAAVTSASCRASLRRPLTLTCRRAAPSTEYWASGLR
jgi:hypothetical protein